MFNGLTGLVLWWKEQMRDLVPASLRPFGQTLPPALVVVAGLSDEATVELFHQSRSGKTSLGQYGLSGTALQEASARVPKARRKSLVLQVCSDDLLEREIELPLAAEQDLKRVVAYEMDRLTPFRADEVLWTCAAKQRDTMRKRLHVRITIIPRARVQPTLTALQQAGLIPIRIEARGGAAPRLAIPLGEGRSNRGWLGSRAEACAFACCCVLAVAAVTLPFILQSVGRAGVDAQINGMQAQVMAAERLRNKIASSATIADAIATARSQASIPLQTIALLTDMLPDDTFLTILSARQRNLTISGKSAAAARLIGVMATHPMVQNPAFTGPVIRDETNGGESFSIRAALGTS